MKLLFCAMKYDYMKPERGTSFEYENFYKTFLNMPEIELIYFPFDEIMIDAGKEKMNEELLAMAKKEQPDILFTFLFTDEIKKETIRWITKNTDVITFNWFADDHWRLDIYSKYWALYFDWVSTTDSKAPEKYFKIGYKNVIKTQWAVNHFLYQPQKSVDIKQKDTELENQENPPQPSFSKGGSRIPLFTKGRLGGISSVPPFEKGRLGRILNNVDVFPRLYQYDVSFVGQPHSDRKKIIRRLEKASIKVECWGKGWPNGRISQEEMVKIFNQSKINLNFTKSSLSPKDFAKIVFKKENNKIKLDLRDISGKIKSLSGKAGRQIKGRNFEIPACGGFLLTERADNLGDYYEPGKEIVVFDGFGDLLEKIQYFLRNDDEREKIAAAGYERTLKEHTYEQRFREIFEKLCKS